MVYLSINIKEKICGYYTAKHFKFSKYFIEFRKSCVIHNFDIMVFLGAINYLLLLTYFCSNIILLDFSMKVIKLDMGSLDAFIEYASVEPT